eukprot:TRINITY_DN4573_c2_g1_i1.p1 TRINITY_DN4573_c2_g1~~TRINITY_DN4573_c2_g1_i1.p1  ORF type:complete len:622 (+),score=193.87 TRINITY_DN4573_c2_g1_i1:129-1868(+)
MEDARGQSPEAAQETGTPVGSARRSDDDAARTTTPRSGGRAGAERKLTPRSAVVRSAELGSELLRELAESKEREAALQLETDGLKQGNADLVHALGELRASTREAQTALIYAGEAAAEAERGHEVVEESLRSELAECRPPEQAREGPDMRPLRTPSPPPAMRPCRSPTASSADSNDPRSQVAVLGRHSRSPFRPADGCAVCAGAGARLVEIQHDLEELRLRCERAEVGMRAAEADAARQRRLLLDERKAHDAQERRSTGVVLALRAEFERQLHDLEQDLVVYPRRRCTERRQVAVLRGLLIGMTDDLVAARVKETALCESISRWDVEREERLAVRKLSRLREGLDADDCSLDSDPLQPILRDWSATLSAPLGATLESVACNRGALVSCESPPRTEGQVCVVPGAGASRSTESSMLPYVGCRFASSEERVRRRRRRAPQSKRAQKPETPSPRPTPEALSDVADSASSPRVVHNGAQEPEWETADELVPTGSERDPREEYGWANDEEEAAPAGRAEPTPTEVDVATQAGSDGASSIVQFLAGWAPESLLQLIADDPADQRPDRIDDGIGSRFSHVSKPIAP